MKNGETRTIGNATIMCVVHRMSWVRREDKWIGRCAPRMSSCRTTYSVFVPGRAPVDGVEWYKNAVRIATTK